MTRALTFSGIVQGIGFRPECLRIANDLGVTGQVKNSGGCTHLTITGNNQALDEFVRRLIAIFEINSYRDEALDEIHFDSFTIAHSENDNATPFITPDLATCKKCEDELKNSNNRRYMHPFISCVNCGPRYTIIDSLPYDRENITMSDFDMCEDCSVEYITPSDRRCHAQTIACKHCGPEISMTIEEAASIIKDGQIAAIKGIGGYHLACRADNGNTIDRLRELKGRETKPFAVMFSSIDEIKSYCRVNDMEEELILSPARPIVLLEKRKELPYSVCGDSAYIGAFLPCNPIQIMLLDKISPLVMTSANISGEPIITDDEEIKKFNVPVLSHNRRILTPIDDSVMCVNAGRIQTIRRARGYVPLAIDIGKKANCDTLCLGGDLKAVFGWHRENYVFLSQHFGDLEDIGVFNCYKENIKRFASLHSFKADKIVCDKHPIYYSSKIYDSHLTVQHHKAHIASVIAEHRLDGNVLGFAFDGTGYGDDGAIWGSEVFAFDGRTFSRLEHLDYVKMPASDEIAKNADYALSCYLGGNELIDKAINMDINTVLSSSMGRLFDAVAALLNVCHYNTYEGECACALERCAMSASSAYKLKKTFNPIEILKEIQSTLDKACVNELALGFHYMLAELICDTAEKYRRTIGTNQIAMSGGVFNNRILTQKAISLLEEKSFSVYINEVVPCGDGGLALGQAYISALEEELCALQHPER